MSNRIKLLVNQSGFDSGVRYRIYRGKFSPVDATKPLIEVDEETVRKRVATAIGVELKQRADAPSCFTVPHYFLETPAPQIYINGAPVGSDSVIFFQKEKMVRINQSFDYPATDIVTMDYQYLQSVITDDCMQTQTGVTHYGNDVPTGLHPPKSIGYTFNEIMNELKIRPTHDNTPDSHFYNVEFLETKTGRTSKAPIDKKITVTPNLLDCRWLLEVSKDEGKTWEALDEQPLSFGEFTITDIEAITTHSHIPLPYTITPITTGAVEIRIKNPWYLWKMNTRDTNLFRIKTVDSMEQESSYKVYPKGSINFRPQNLVIRRKWDNGSPATKEGDDAITLHALTESIVGGHDAELVFIDDHLKPGVSYSYTFHLDDDAGFITPPFWMKVDLPE